LETLEKARHTNVPSTLPIDNEESFTIIQANLLRILSLQKNFNIITRTTTTTTHLKQKVLALDPICLERSLSSIEVLIEAYLNPNKTEPLIDEYSPASKVLDSEYQQLYVNLMISSRHVRISTKKNNTSFRHFTQYIII
jgi:hypothetical protein